MADAPAEPSPTVRERTRRPPSDPDGPTGRLTSWLDALTLDEVPGRVRERAVHLMLDGFGCLLIGSHLPWSATGVDGVTSLDNGTGSIIAGWDRTTSAPSSTLLNSSFIQGFELDDYYPPAPVHINSIVLPVLIALSGVLPEMSGEQWLLATIRGYEVAGRVGRALHGPEMLTRGWHSGAVFGPSAAAVTAGTLYGLDASGLEDALGMAMTQSCGLMSAQFESMVKRMQHGFASRNGLYGAALAAAGYVGIKQVFERSYGGYLSVFGEGHDPVEAEIYADLGSRWDTELYAIKPYAAMGALHAGIDAVFALQAEKPIDPSTIQRVDVTVGDAAYQHGGFAISRPITPTTAQMSLAYATSVAMLDHAALMPQFRPDRINRDDVWALIAKTQMHCDKSFNYTTVVKLTMADGSTREHRVDSPTGGLDHPLSNDSIISKFRSLTGPVLDDDRRDALQAAVLGLERDAEAPRRLLDLIRAPVPNALG